MSVLEGSWKGLRKIDRLKKLKLQTAMEKRIGETSLVLSVFIVFPFPLDRRCDRIFDTAFSAAPFG